MFKVAISMRFSKVDNWLCENHKGERFISRSKANAVRFQTREEAAKAEQAINHRDRLHGRIVEA